MIYDLFDFTKQTGIVKQTLITSYNISINSQPNAKNGCDIGLCWFNVSHFPDHFVIRWNCKKTHGLELQDWENLFAQMGSNKFNKSSAIMYLKETTRLSSKEVRESLKKFKNRYYEVKFNLLNS